MNIEKKYLSPENFVYKELNTLYGIGFFLSKQVCDYLGFSKTYKIKNLSHRQTESLIRILDQFYIFESKLETQRKHIYQKLLFIKSVKGLRRKNGLPCRGQRTHTNGRTAAKFARKF